MFEIRNYHYDPAKFDAYKQWAVELAVPCLKEVLEVVGFWVDDGTPAELTGSDPTEHKHGPANITWILRWDSKEARDAGFQRLLENERWQDAWAKHPDANGYLQMEARFAEEI